ncbi:hypothetical protein ACP70R_017806 [Stipagrostis hirtigluma subsp. patula]
MALLLLLLLHSAVDRHCCNAAAFSVSSAPTRRCGAAHLLLPVHLRRPPASSLQQCRGFLSRKYHPAMNKIPGLEEKFNEISAAMR